MEREKSFFDSLNQTLQSPMFLGGAALLSGEGFSGAAQGMRMGNQMQEQERQRQSQAQQQQQFQGTLQNPNISKHLPPGLAQIAASMGPGPGAQAVIQFLKPKPATPAMRNYKRAKQDPGFAQFLDRNKGAGSQAKYGLTPITGVDENGNTVLLQPSSAGGVRQAQLPDGVSISKKPLKLDAGTHHILIDPVTRQQVGTIPKDLAGAASQQATGQAQGKAQADLPRAVETGDRMLKMLDDLSADKNLDNMVGSVQGRLPNVSSAASETQARMDQITGAAFLQAFQQLKGGGHITEIEGEKATAAITRLGTVTMDESAYRQAIDDLRGIVQGALQRARQQAGSTGHNTTSDPLGIR